MVPILVGKKKHEAYACRKKGHYGENYSIYNCSRSNQVPETDQIPEIAPTSCAPISKLPSNSSKMVLNKFNKADR